jgi:hypothetical protein
LPVYLSKGPESSAVTGEIRISHLVSVGSHALGILEEGVLELLTLLWGELRAKRLHQRAAGSESLPYSRVVTLDATIRTKPHLDVPTAVHGRVRERADAVLAHT